MDTGTVAAFVSIIGMVFSFFGASIDPQLISGAVQGGIAIATFVAAVWSWYQHRQKTAALVAAGVR